MILRHFTHRRFLPAIVARGGLSVKDTGGHYLQFEWNPPSDRLLQTMHDMRSSGELTWDETDTVALDFDFVKMQAADIEVLEQVKDVIWNVDPDSSVGPSRFVKSFLSLGYLTEESREQLSEYY
ncbi:hypothetical protein HNY42_08545 [Exiguobacterium sp. Helios]|uniref:hypothetical protein n=1 Tax=Exiguobacterium sp. Helios TaxID=2735868 RepID=UPI00103B7407|nr:hypothetical protein [Exiguobacterium sp. Helios]QNR20981.1 hypothetical protein HNY42_08545 [Exiguobacterium sp. Helios]